MADQLIQIVTAVGVAPAGIAVIPHNINSNGVRYIPDEVALDGDDFAVIATTATTITVQNNGAAVASCNVLLKLWQSNTRALGPSTQTNNFAGGLTPRPFVVAAGAGGGGGSGVIYSFVFGVGGTDTGNYFATWNLLVAAMSAVPGKKQLFFEDASTTIPVGAWDMTDTKWVGMAIMTTVIVHEGTTFPNFRAVDENIGISWDGLTPPVDDFAGTDSVFSVSNGSRIDGTAATGPFLRWNAGVGITTAVLPIFVGAQLSGGNPIAHMAEAAPLLVVVGQLGQVGDNTLSSAAGAAVVLLWSSSSATISETQPAVAGTLVPSNQTQAQYNPTDVKTANYGALTNELVLCDPTGGSFNVTLPLAFNHRGKQVVVKNVTSSNIAINVLPSGGDTIDGAASVTIVEAFGSLEVASDGAANWNIISADGSVGPDTIYSFVYSAAGTNTGNYFNDWTLLCAAIALVPGKKQLFFALDHGPIPAGTWDMTNCKWLGTLRRADPAVGTLVTFDNDGTVITGLREVGDNLLLANYSGTSVINDLDDGDKFTLSNYAALYPNINLFAALITPISGTVTIELEEGAYLVGGVVSPIDGASANIRVVGGEATSMGVDVIMNADVNNSLVYQAASARLSVLCNNGGPVIAAANITVADRPSMSFTYNSAAPAWVGDTFINWTELATLVAATPGVNKEILFVQDEVIPAGTWDMTNCAWRGQNNQGPVIQRLISLAAGVVLTGFRELTHNLTLESLGAPVPIADFNLPDGFPTTFILDWGARLGGGALGAVMDAGPNAAVENVIYVNNGSSIESSDPGIVVTISGAPATANWPKFIVGEYGTIAAQCIDGQTTAAATLAWGADTANISEDQVDFIASWQDQSPNGIDIRTRTRNLPRTTTDTDIAAVINDEILVSALGAPVAVNLQTIGPVGTTSTRGCQIIIKKITGTGAGSAITIDADGTDTIDGAATLVIPATADFVCVVLQSDGVSDWRVISYYDPANIPGAGGRQTFLFTAAGTELAAGFTVTLPASRPSTSYQVIYTLNDVATVFVPTFPAAGRAVNQFTCVPGINLTAGDTIQFTVVPLP